VEQKKNKRGQKRTAPGAVKTHAGKTTGKVKGRRWVCLVTSWGFFAGAMWVLGEKNKSVQETGDRSVNLYLGLSHCGEPLRGPLLKKRLGKLGRGLRFGWIKKRKKKREARRAGGTTHINRE